MSSECQPVLCMQTSNEQVLFAVVTVREMPGRNSPSCRTSRIMPSSDWL